jgi:hypothetical protein
MKKQLYTLGIVAAILLSSISITAQNNSQVAQNDKPETLVKFNGNQSARNFIDENNNSICNRFENAKPLGKGPNFIDPDKNGICDHREKGNRGHGRGFGYQHRNGQRNGQCCGRGPCSGKGWGKR